jgi:hypothetical protein
MCRENCRAPAKTWHEVELEYGLRIGRDDETPSMSVGAVVSHEPPAKASKMTFGMPDSMANLMGRHEEIDVAPGCLGEAFDAMEESVVDACVVEYLDKGTDHARSEGATNPRLEVR